MAVQVFGAGAVQTAYVSYLALDITLNSLTLVWADAYVDVPYTDPNTGIHYQALAAYMDVTTPLINVNTITLPDATQTSVGQNFIISNVGQSNFSLNTSDGSLLQVVATGIKYYAILTDNSTAAGTWSVATFAAGTSQASATALAGNGLVAILDKLNTAIAVVSVVAPPIIDLTYRAKLIVWTGGAATLTLPAIGTVPADAAYYISFSNQGGAQIIIQPGEPVTTISGSLTLAVQPQQSLTIISDGTNWQTLGFGQNQFAISSSLTLNVSASVNVTLSQIQASSIIQQYTGALTANITVFFPLETNEWFIYNNTTGAHTLSVQLAGPTGAAYIIPQGSKGIFYSDGTSMSVSPTALSLADGSAATPTLSFSSTPTTGIYNAPTLPGIAVSVGGAITGSFQTTGTAGTIVTYSANGTSLVLLSDNTVAGIGYNNIGAISINGTGNVEFSVGPLTLDTGQFLAPNGTEAAPALSFSANTNTGIYSDPGVPAVAVSVGGVLAGSFQTSGTAGGIVAFSAAGTPLQLISSNTTGSVTYNSIPAISISNAGVVSLPTAPLPIGSGGTNAINAPVALNNLLPAAAAGTILYYNGANWVSLPIGTPAQVLTVTSPTTIGWA